MSGDDGRHRLGLVAVMALSLFGALFARLWFLQVVEGPSLDAQAARNATRTVVIPAPRGRILDRNAIVMVDNRESIVVSISWQDYMDLKPEVQRHLLTKLATTLSKGRTPDQAVTTRFLRTRLNDSRFSHFRPVPVADDITYDQEIILREEADQYPTVSVDRQTVRRYPYGSLAAHLLGYVGPLSDTQWQKLSKDNDKTKPYVQTDEVGKAGVEATYEQDLRGTPGRRVYEVDRRNRVVGEITSDRVEPKPGDDLYLSIDARVQYKAEAALQGRLVAARGSHTPAQSGGVVVLDPRNGQVRAMASFPTYNPADLVGGISCPVWRDLQGLDPAGSCKDVDAEIKAMAPEARPVSKLINRALAGAYAPASTFKLATAYAALNLGLITPQDTISDPGEYRLCPGSQPGCLKRNAGHAAHGTVDLRKALTVSSDVYFYRIGDIAWKQRARVGDDGLQRYIKQLGYGSRTGIDLPAESPGLVPTPKTEADTATALFKADPGNYGNDPAEAKAAGRWRGGYSADLAIGQKVTATPLQIANAYASLANGGNLWTPGVLDHTTPAHQPTKILRQFKPKLIRRIDWGTARDTFLAGFQGVVDHSVTSDDGTAVLPFQNFPFSSLPLAGKTGTAQTGLDKLNNKKPENSLFVGFELGADPAWAASAVLEGAGSGANAAAPTIRLILEPIASHAIDSFMIPALGAIDPTQVAAATNGISTAGSD